MWDRGWLSWETDALDWPYRENSQFISVAGYRWHVQLIGPENVPVFLLIHGTGAASFSWRNMIPLLSDRYRLVVLDLPCHGFTRPNARPDLSIQGMTDAIRGLLHHLAVDPQVILGHSAGAVIGLYFADADRGERPRDESDRHVFSINGALKPIRGNRLLSPLAKLLFVNPVSASAFSTLTANTRLGENLLEATGSRIDTLGSAIYRRLLSSSGHVQGALGMMASWDLGRINAILRRTTIPFHLYAVQDDPMVPPSNSRKAAALARNADLTVVASGGHLVHESHPHQIVDWIEATLNAGTLDGVKIA